MISEIDPLLDPRWNEFVSRHPASSPFHTSAWLEALKRTYLYQPVALVTPSFDAALVFCEVNSWLTGARIVSLPFADHCDVLASHPEQFTSLLEALQSRLSHGKHRYAELRTRSLVPEPFLPSQRFHYHILHLAAGPEAVFRGFHKSCIQRKIRRAERESVSILSANSGANIDAFYALLLRTRRRHRLPPQPRAWFRNLSGCLKDAIRFHVAFWREQPIASIVTIEHRDTLYYKYGASNADFHHLGAMPLLFWNAIQDAARRGLRSFDLGRSDLDSDGLKQFKEHLGATPSMITYTRYPAVAPRDASSKLLGWICAHAPDRCLTLLGSALYRHSA